MHNLLQIKLLAQNVHEIEIIDFHKTDEGNHAVIFMPDNPVSPWIAVVNIQQDPRTGKYFWDRGHYFDARYRAEKKFYEMVGVLEEKKT